MVLSDGLEYHCVLVSQKTFIENDQTITNGVEPTSAIKVAAW
jgi:hypothetical protein